METTKLNKNGIGLEVGKERTDLYHNIGLGHKLDTRVHLTYNDVQIVPGYSTIPTRSECILKTRITRNFELYFPLVASPMDTVCGGNMAYHMFVHGGIGFIHRFFSIEDQANEVEYVFERILRDEYGGDSDQFDRDYNDYQIAIGAAIGATGDYFERAEALIKAGANVLLLDIAHGHHEYTKTALQKLKAEYPNVDVVAGNVATAKGSRDLCEWGADGVRVGIGNGSLCETRIRTGVGVPQVSALLEAVEVAQTYGVPVMADGGVKKIGDICKALAIGAETVMVGSLLAGTKETPGTIKREGHWPNERLYKAYRGSASVASKVDRGEEDKNVEGNSSRIEYKGKVKRILDDIKDGIRSSMSYVGTRSLDDFRDKAQLIRVSQAGHIEGTPHFFLDS